MKSGGVYWPLLANEIDFLLGNWKALQMIYERVFNMTYSHFK